MGQKSRHLDRKSALDEALRRMMTSCPAPPELQSMAEELAGRATRRPSRFTRGESR
jgi:hypothetical protein